MRPRQHTDQETVRIAELKALRSNLRASVKLVNTELARIDNRAAIRTETSERQERRLNDAFNRGMA